MSREKSSFFSSPLLQSFWGSIGYMGLESLSKNSTFKRNSSYKFCHKKDLLSFWGQIWISSTFLVPYWQKLICKSLHKLSILYGAYSNSSITMNTELMAFLLLTLKKWRAPSTVTTFTAKEPTSDSEKGADCFWTPSMKKLLNFGYSLSIQWYGRRSWGSMIIMESISVTLTCACEKKMRCEVKLHTM